MVGYIDGTTLEGGGQLLRLSLSLSSLTKVPFHIVNIRGKRGPKSNPGKDGGIKPAHLAGAEWLAAATNAQTEGMKVKSKDLIFTPSQSQAQGQRPNALWKSAVWKDIRDGNKLVRRESKITMTSVGSIFLVLQAILPYIFFSSVPSDPSDPNSPAAPVHLSITGGTNVWHSLSYEYAEHVLFPMLHHKVGLPLIRMKLVRRGWSQGNNSLGEVRFIIQPLQPGTQLPSFSLTDRGELVRIKVAILAPDANFRSSIRDLVVEKLLHHFPDTEIEFPVDENAGADKRLSLLLIAETQNGYRLGRDWLFDQRIDKDDPQRTIRRLVGKVVSDLQKELAHGGCVDEYLQDQLAVFQVLSQGRSMVQGGEPSLHTRTTWWLAEHFLQVKFDSDGSCTGLGLVAGESAEGTS